MTPIPAPLRPFAGPDCADDVVEARLAARLAIALTRANESLPHDVTERLRFARERSLGAAAQARRLATASANVTQVSHAGVLSLGRVPGWLQGMAALLPVVVLVAGLVLIDDRVQQEQVRAVADIDSQLLSDSLPPQAYTDPGFAEFLRSEPPP